MVSDLEKIRIITFFFFFMVILHVWTQFPSALKFVSSLCSNDHGAILQMAFLRVPIGSKSLPDAKSRVT